MMLRRLNIKLWPATELKSDMLVIRSGFFLRVDYSYHAGISRDFAAELIHVVIIRQVELHVEEIACVHMGFFNTFCQYAVRAYINSTAGENVVVQHPDLAAKYPYFDRQAFVLPSLHVSSHLFRAFRLIRNIYIPN